MKDLNLLKEDINEYVNALYDINIDMLEHCLDLSQREEGEQIKEHIYIINDLDREGFDEYLKDIIHPNFNKYDDEDLYDELYKYFKDKMKDMYYAIYEKAGYDDIERDRSNEDMIYLIKY